MAALILLAGCGGAEGSRVGQEAPADDVLKQLCDESYETAYAQFEVVGEVAKTEKSLGLDGGENSLECEGGDAWTFEADGQQDTRVEMALVFGAVADPASPEDDYCSTEGVRVNLPLTDFEEREFDGHPYCFSWHSGDRPQSASSSYVDRSTHVYLVWSVDFDGDAFDTDTEVGSLLSAANGAVLGGVYEGFSQAA